MLLFLALKLYYFLIESLIAFSDTFKATLEHCFDSGADCLMDPIVTISEV